MYVRPLVDFPYIKIVGEIKEKENYVTFRGINCDNTKKSEHDQDVMYFTFVAFGGIKERIKHLKVQKFSEVRIGAYLRKYVNGDHEAHSYEIVAIDYTIVPQSSKGRMYGRPFATFPYIKTVGEIKEKENHTTFRGINGDLDSIGKNDKKQDTMFFTFNAFGDMKERIKRLKVQKFSEVRIGAYLRKYLNGDYEAYSFEVVAIDYLVMPQKSKAGKDHEDIVPECVETEETTEQSLSEPDTDTSSEKPVKDNEEKPVKVIDNTGEDNISIKELEEMFSN